MEIIRRSAGTIVKLVYIWSQGKGFVRKLVVGVGMTQCPLGPRRFIGGNSMGHWAGWFSFVILRLWLLQQIS